MVFGILCVVFGVQLWHSTVAFGVWHVVFVVWHSNVAFGIWHLAFGIWHLACGCGTWHVAFGSGSWCVACDCGMWHSTVVFGMAVLAETVMGLQFLAFYCGV